MPLIDKSKLLFIAIFCGVLIAVTLIYSNHFHNDFQFDDSHSIQDNVWIRSLESPGKFFTNIETRSTLPANRQYRPLLTLSFAVDYALAGGLDPFYFHLSNFIVFLLQLIAMYFLYDRIFNIAFSHRWNRYFALGAVAWYGVHTANAETINYISARSDLYSTFLVIVGLLAYIYLPRYFKFLWLIPLTVGMLIKPTTAMFAPLLIAYIFFFECRASFHHFFFDKRRIYERPLFQGCLALLVSGALFALVIAMTPETWVASHDTWFEYLRTQTWVILHYFKTFFLPTQLTADSDWGIIPTFFDIRVIAGALFLVLIALLLFLAARRQRYLPVSYGLSWTLLALLPSSSVIPLAEVLNYHRLFFPYIGLTMAVMWSIAVFVYRFEAVFKHSWAKIVLMALFIAILSANAFGTVERNRVWRTGETLWYDVTIKSPKNGRGLMNYGLSQMTQGDYDRALSYFTRSLELMPRYTYLHINLGIVNEALGNSVAAEQFFRKAILYDGTNPQPYYFYGNWLARKQRYGEAIRSLRQSLYYNTSYMAPRHLLMQIYAGLEDWDALQPLVEETLKISPQDPVASQYDKQLSGR